MTTYAPLPSFLKSARNPRISTHSEQRHGLPGLTYRSSSGSSSICSISSTGSEDDKKAGIERRDRDKQQRSTTVQGRCHSSDKAAKQCARSQQLMNEADSYVITLRQEKQHKLPVCVASNKQDPTVSEHGNTYEGLQTHS